MDHLAHFFSRFQTARQRLKRNFSIPYTKKSWHICTVLYAEGLLLGFGPDRLIRPQILVLHLKYKSSGPLPMPVIHSIKQISRQGRRVYTPAGDLNDSSDRLFLLSTSRGILSSQEARFFRVGGEVLCEVRKLV